jgi:hypothetical protein
LSLKTCKTLSALATTRTYENPASITSATTQHDDGLLNLATYFWININNFSSNILPSESLVFDQM